MNGGREDMEQIIPLLLIKHKRKWSLQNASLARATFKEEKKQKKPQQNHDQNNQPES